MDQCGDSIVSEVTWHEPLKFGDETSAIYLESITLKGVTDNHENNPNASLLVGSTELDVMDYGFLHFTAQTAVLTLRWATENSGNCASRAADGDKADPDAENMPRTFWARAAIHSPEGERIGMLDVPSQFFNE